MFNSDLVQGFVAARTLRTRINILLLARRPVARF